MTVDEWAAARTSQMQPGTRPAPGAAAPGALLRLIAEPLHDALAHRGSRSWRRRALGRAARREFLARPRARQLFEADGALQIGARRARPEPRRPRCCAAAALVPSIRCGRRRDAPRRRQLCGQYRRAGGACMVLRNKSVTIRPTRRRPATMCHAGATIWWEKDMFGRTSATPLLALEATVLDTETTGLDPAKARIVEVAAIRLSADLERADAFHQKLNPGEPIPAAGTAIHGIDDKSVAGLASFARVWPVMVDFIGESVLIGHSLGYDLAVIKRECARAGLAWKNPRALDTGFLARVVEPHLPGYSLEQLAAWLEVAPGERHSAYGDALTTARVFRASFRNSVIWISARWRKPSAPAARSPPCKTRRTRPDGSRSRHRSRLLDDQPPRVDTYPYRHRVRDVMTAPREVHRGRRARSARRSNTDDGGAGVRHSTS